MTLYDNKSRLMYCIIQNYESMIDFMVLELLYIVR